MDTAAAVERFRAERRYLLDQGNSFYAASATLAKCNRVGRDALSKSEIEANRDRGAELAMKGADMHDRYETLLPAIPVARCPYTDEVLRWPIDTINLDGWFWEYERPTRRLADLPLTHLAFTGAMRVAEPIPFTDFDVEPGPGVPYVIPRILEHPEITAVIAQLPIGPHTGWPINYFGSRSTGEEMVNEWGSYMYDPHGPGGEWLGWATNRPLPRELDFDLAPWVESGKLRWIAPDDESMTLRAGMEGCPYIDLQGPRATACIREGVLRYRGSSGSDSKP